MIETGDSDGHEDYHLLELPDSQGKGRSLSRSPASSPPVLVRRPSPASDMDSNPEKRSYEKLGDAEFETSREDASLDASAVKISASQTGGPLLNDIPEAPFVEPFIATKSEQTMSMPPPKLKQGGQKQQMPTPEERPDSSDSTISGPADSDRAATPELPDQQIADFDWTDLETQYHRRMNELKLHENSIMKEFDKLIEFFGVWASMSQTHEVDRSFKRLKTQMALVQHEETELEEKRKHYIGVVEAFKRALKLLGP